MTGIVCSLVGATFSVAAAATIIRYKNGITAIGSAQVSTAQSKFGGSSLIKSSATADYLKITDATSLQFTGDFTIETWIRISTLNEFNVIYSNFNSSLTGIYFAYWNNATKFSVYINGSERLSATATLSANTWYHIALVRSGSTLTVYRDGTSLGTGTYSGTITTPTYSGIGINSDGSQQGIIGYMDEIRISKTARYTTTFTPSTTPFVNDDNTLLLIHCDGTNASTYFEDDNGTGRAQKSIIAQNGAQVSTTQSKFSGTSASFNGTSDIQLRANDVDVLSGNFTIEFWIRPNNGTYIVFSNRPSASFGSNEMFCYYVSSSNRLEWNINGYGSLSVSNTTMTYGNWYHCAWVRVGTTVTLYVNGVAQTDTKTSYSADIGNSSRKTWYFGSIDGANDEYNGYLDEIRISNTARYTSNFTAPVLPFTNDTNTLLLIHADGTNASTVFRDDNGATAATTAGTAVAFDGTGDYYSATGITTSATDSGKVLISGSIYWAGGNNLQHIVNLRLGTGSGDYGFWVWINGGRMQCKMVTGTGSVPTSIYENAENSLTSGAWNHFVIYWDTASYTTNTKIYTNGISRAISNEGTSANTWNWGNTATTIQIGQKNSSQTGDGTDFQGNIGQIYIHNPSSFPGIEYFWNQGPRDLGTNGTKTGLAQPLIYHYGDNSTFRTNNGTGFSSYTLTANGNAGSAVTNLPTYYSPRYQKGVQVTGNAQIDNAQSKFGGTSALFDGTGDYLTISNDSAMAGWNSQNFTVEFWIRPNTMTSLQSTPGVTAIPNVIGNMSPTGSGNYWSFGPLNNGSVRFFYYNGSEQTLTTTGVTLTTGNWYHLAFVRNGSTIKIYVDGTERASGSVSGTPQFDSAFSFTIGQYNNTSMNGWVDEVRISNTVRYTANFTTATTPFTNDGNTLLLLHMDGTDASTVFIDDNGIADHTA